MFKFHRQMMMRGGHDGHRSKEQEMYEEQYNKQNEVMKKLEGQVENNNREGGSAGYGYQVCDMERLKRFLILGSEFNTYYCSAPKLLTENVKCVMNLLKQNQHQKLLDTVDQYNREGRAAKDDPLITVLAMCATHERNEVKKAAYDKVNSICNIPTKLFKFIDMTHSDIVRKRIENPPQPQKYRVSKKRKHVTPEEAISELSIQDEEEEKREPSENVDETKEAPQPPKKKVKKEKEFKVVNTRSTKSLGWGRMRRNGVAKFYSDNRKDACRLLYLMTKYKQRNDWSHKEVLKYSHPKMSGENRDPKNLVVKYCIQGWDKVKDEIETLAKTPGLGENMSEVIAYIKVLDDVSHLKPDVEGDEAKLIECLELYGRRQQAKEFTTQHSFEGSTTKGNYQGKKSSIQIVREHIPTGFLNSLKVWELMLMDMPMTAMIRNLGKMSSLGLFEDNKNVKLVTSALGNDKRLQSARVHPVKLLIAAETYKQGHGDKGSLTWKAHDAILKALDVAFYKSFRSPEIGAQFKTDKKYMLCLDVSGSMQGRGCFGCEALSPATGTAAMSMVTWNIEDDSNVEIMGFGGYFMDLKAKVLKKGMTVSEAMKAISRLNFGSTDCSLPMVYALTERKEVDVFIVYTDNETNCGAWQPMQALKIYNHEMNRNAKLIVCAMSSAGFTIADPNCPNAMDICGFDANVPEIIYNFVKDDKKEKCDVCEDCKKRL